MVCLVLNSYVRFVADIATGNGTSVRGQSESKPPKRSMTITPQILSLKRATKRRRKKQASQLHQILIPRPRTRSPHNNILCNCPLQQNFASTSIWHFSAASCSYNLTIFLLASELRPFSHLLKMIQARTLHLQRIVATNPHSPSDSISSSALQDLQSRLAELENHVADTTSNGSSSKSAPSDLTTQIRKNIQPDLEALNRAVRRYEKRATLLTMQTESRLQELEKRMGDAITLAAAAERSAQSNRQRRGSGVGLWWTGSPR